MPQKIKWLLQKGKSKSQKKKFQMSEEIWIQDFCKGQNTKSNWILSIKTQNKKWTVKALKLSKKMKKPLG